MASGQLNLRTVKLGDNADTSKNFLITTPAVADGTLSIQRENGTHVLDVDASGNLTATGKISQAIQSMVRLNTANGYGSTNTKIRRFTNVVTNQGTDITYADSATLGASFTINTSGTYGISYSDQFATAEAVFITINDSAPTTTPVVGDILGGASTPGANQAASTSCTLYLAIGSVIRARSSAGTATGVSTYVGQFIITRVA